MGYFARVCQAGVEAQKAVNIARVEAGEAEIEIETLQCALSSPPSSSSRPIPQFNRSGKLPKPPGPLLIPADPSEVTGSSGGRSVSAVAPPQSAPELRRRRFNF